tara:strand:- start:2551 stop:4146 length:1596 start_codon:yes stop_codon:yes gene_type:complete
MAPSRKRIAQAAVLGTLGAGAAVALHRRSRSRKSIEESAKKELERERERIQEKIVNLRAEENDRKLTKMREVQKQQLVEIRQQQEQLQDEAERQEQRLKLQAEMEQRQKEKDEWTAIERQKQIKEEVERIAEEERKRNEQDKKLLDIIEEEQKKRKQREAEDEKKRKEREAELLRDARIQFYGKKMDETPEDIKRLLYDPEEFLKQTNGEWVRVGAGAYGEVFKRGNIAWKHFKGGKQAMHDECEMHKLVESLIPNHVPKLILCWESRLHSTSGMFMEFLSGAVPLHTAIRDQAAAEGRKPQRRERDFHILESLSESVIVQMCHIVDTLNENGIGHNDMHFNNVMYDKTLDRIYLIDFGLTKQYKKDDKRQFTYNDMVGLASLCAMRANKFYESVAGLDLYHLFHVIDSGTLRNFPKIPEQYKVDFENKLQRHLRDFGSDVIDSKSEYETISKLGGRLVCDGGDCTKLDDETIQEGLSIIPEGSTITLRDRESKYPYFAFSSIAEQRRRRSTRKKRSRSRRSRRRRRSNRR